MAQYHYRKCKLCGEIIKALGIHNSNGAILAHLQEKHGSELKKMNEAGEKYDKAMYQFRKKMLKKYPHTQRGEFFTDVTPPIKTKEWTCPDCGKTMGYHYKYYHEANCDVAEKRRKREREKLAGL